MSRDLSDLLGPDEHVVLSTRQHPWVLFVDAGAWLLGLVVTGGAIWYSTSAGWLDNRAGGWLTNALWVLFAAIVLVIVWRAINWLVQRFYVTTSKVVYVHGVLQRDVVSVPLVKLDEVTLVRPLLGRMLGFGRLDVENASGGKAPLAGLEYLPRSVEIYRTVTERARHQRLLEGGGHADLDADGLVDRPDAGAPAEAPGAAPGPAPADGAPLPPAAADGTGTIDADAER
jgi:membrane protein YdbS with pleckstrin-like domain